jgi:hypothetical protein
MSIELQWLDGGTAQVLETDGEVAVLRSTRAAAPGQPLTGKVGMRAAAQLRLKVQGCRREQDGTYRLRGRWLDLTRAAREELVRAGGGPAV